MRLAGRHHHSPQSALARCNIGTRGRRYMRREPRAVHPHEQARPDPCASALATPTTSRTHALPPSIDCMSVPSAFRQAVEKLAAADGFEVVSATADRLESNMYKFAFVVRDPKTGKTHSKSSTPQKRFGPMATDESIANEADIMWVEIKK